MIAFDNEHQLTRRGFQLLPVIQLAQLSGFSPIITTASSHNAAYLKSLGATHVIDRSAPLVSSVQAITSEPISIVYDSISLEETQTPAYDILAPNGKLILVLESAIDQEKLTKGEKQGKTLVWVYGAVYDQTQREIGLGLYKHFTEAFESGDLKVCSWYKVRFRLVLLNSWFC